MSTKTPQEIVAAEIKRLEQDLLPEVLGVGEKVKNFSLSNQHGKLIHLENVLATGPAVITFYRGSWCPYCILQLQSFEASIPEFDQLNATVLAIGFMSAGNYENERQEKGDNPLSYSVLSDVGGEVAEAFGLKYRMSEDMINLYQGYGLSIESYNVHGDWDLPLAGTFLIDQQGIVKYVAVSADYRTRLSAEALLADWDKILKG